MAFKAILKVDGQERQLLTYHNYFFDMRGIDFELVPKPYATYYDFMNVAKASPYTFKRRNVQPFGGLIDITMESTDEDDFFYYWFKPNKITGKTPIYHGVIELYDGNDEYMPMQRIEFWDAWISEISESQSSTSYQPMILNLTISPATLRFNKEVVFQKSWWQTDINAKEAQSQDKAEPAVKRIYWKGRKKGAERKDIMLNHNIELIVEFSKFEQGDNVELTIKQSNGRRIKGQAKEFTINGTIDENGLMIIPDFKVECDFKEDNQDFGDIEFYYNDNKVGELKENFGWTWIKDGVYLKIFVNIELVVAFTAAGCLPSDYENAINNQFRRTLELSSGGLVTGKIFFSGTHVYDRPQVVPLIKVDEEPPKQAGMVIGVGAVEWATIRVASKSTDDGELLEDFGETAVHELLHTLRLDHPFERIQTEDTKLVKIGKNQYKSTPKNDPNIYYNIMNYDSIYIDGHKLNDLWKNKRPEYITKGQIQFIFNEIDAQKKGSGAGYNEYYKMSEYWEYPGEEIK